MFTEVVTIRPTLPFNFDLSAMIFSNGDPQIRTYRDGVFTQVIRVNDVLVLVNVSREVTVDPPILRIELNSVARLAEQDIEKVKNTVSRLFNLDSDPTPFYEAVRNDETMSKITQRLYGLRSPSTPTVFEALIDSIAEQQISLIVATSIEKRMIKKFGESIEVDGDPFYSYPTPKELSSVSIDDLRSCGLSRNKAIYIKEIAELVTTGEIDLEDLKALDSTEEIIAQLDSLKGIGPWTAELTVIRSMQRWDALPADDIGLRRAISHYYCGEERITSDQARKIAEAWGKWRGLAAFYLIIAELLGVEV